MKKILLGIAALVSLYAGGLYFSGLKESRNLAIAPTPTENVLGSEDQEVTDIIATDLVTGDDISLIPNFTNSKTGSEIFTQNKCEFLVNGGFYTREAKPVGLFKSNNVTIRDEHESALFDGFLTVNKIGTPRITRVLPSDDLSIALQAGPVLIENGHTVPLSIRNDSPERRMVALITGENKIQFVMVQSSTLTSLPEVIFKWAKAQKILVADVINLDGGSASTFRSKDISIPEISPIGSAFCISPNN